MKDFKRVMTDLALNMHFEEAQNQRKKLKFGEPVPFYDCQRKLPIDAFDSFR
jgi:hypothetical protein